MSFLELFFSRWILICGIFFVICFWSWFSLSRAPDTYRATAQLLIRRGSVDAVRQAPIMRQQEEVGSEIDIFKSLAVIDEAVDQLFPVLLSTYEPVKSRKYAFRIAARFWELFTRYGFKSA